VELGKLLFQVEVFWTVYEDVRSSLKAERLKLRSSKIYKSDDSK
jgi:hypothetical protein